MPSPVVNGQLAEFVSQFYADPYGFVCAAYPWSQPGTELATESGPDTWQRTVLEDIGHEVTARGFNGHDAVMPIRKAISKGHGVGGSALAAWLVDWIMSTRPDAQGSVTANTMTQLETKTWAAIRRWTALCLTSHWFTVTSEKMYYTARPAAWFCARQSSREENTEAFAGQHAKNSTSFYINDEDSAVSDQIHIVEEGGLTDGEPMIFLFGNPTRSTGAFHAACFGAQRHRWNPVIVDSRSSKLANQAQIHEWIQDYGEDSDFVRVRVRGLPPRASELQFIDSDTVSAAQQRPAVALPDDPLICGLDLARGGSDKCVFRFRRGNDARSIPPIAVPGEQAKDSMKIVALAADVLDRTHAGRSVSMMFVDATGGSIGGPIADRLRQLGHKNVIDVQFGGESPDPKAGNMRAYMWSKMRDALRSGLAIDNSVVLATDLTGPGYFHDKRDRLILESKESMKKRGVDSPDDGDGLALCFALPVKMPKPTTFARASGTRSSSTSWLGV